MKNILLNLKRRIVSYREKKRAIKNMLSRFEKVTDLLTEMAIADIGINNDWPKEYIKRKDAWLKFIFKRSKHELIKISSYLLVWHNMKTESSFGIHDEINTIHEEFNKEMYDIFQSFDPEKGFDSDFEERFTKEFSEVKNSENQLSTEKQDREFNESNGQQAEEPFEYDEFYSFDDPNKNICSGREFNKAKKLVLLYSFLDSEYKLESFLKEKNVEELKVIDEYISVAYSLLQYFKRFHVGKTHLDES